MYLFAYPPIYFFKCIYLSIYLFIYFQMRNLLPSALSINMTNDWPKIVKPHPLINIHQFNGQAGYLAGIEVNEI